MMQAQMSSHSSYFSQAREADEQIDLEKLRVVLDEATERIATGAGFSKTEALEILEKVRVEMIGEIKRALEALDNGAIVKQTDEARLVKAVGQAIASICNATNLDTDEVTSILTEEVGAPMDTLVHRLRAKTRSEARL